MQQADAKLIARVGAHFAESARLKTEAAPLLGAPIAQAGLMLAQSLKAGGKALACGNGGSAADAQHFAAQLGNRFQAQRPAPPARAPTPDSPNLTSNPHDYPWDQVVPKPPPPPRPPRDA